MVNTELKHTIIINNADVDAFQVMGELQPIAGKFVTALGASAVGALNDLKNLEKALPGARYFNTIESHRLQYQTLTLSGLRRLCSRNGYPRAFADYCKEATTRGFHIPGWDDDDVECELPTLDKRSPAEKCGTQADDFEPTNALVTINGHQVTRLEWNGEPVVTFKMIDELHERPKGTAKRNFTENVKRMLEGKHYFHVTKQDVKGRYENRTDLLMDKYAPSTALITEAGYLLLVKSFTDDLAWKVQDQLVDTYFEYEKLRRAQQMPDPQAHLNDPAWLRRTLIGYTEQVEKLTNEVKGQQQKLEAAKVVIDSSRAEIKETRKELGAKERELKKTAAVLRVKEVEVDELTSIIEQLIKTEGSITLDEAAKCFGWGPRKFDALLRERGWLLKEVKPRAGASLHVKKGNLVHKVTTYTSSHGVTYVTTQVRVTGQGLEQLARMMKRWEK